MTGHNEESFISRPNTAGRGRFCMQDMGPSPVSLVKSSPRTRDNGTHYSCPPALLSPRQPRNLRHISEPAKTSRPKHGSCNGASGPRVLAAWPSMFPLHSFLFRHDIHSLWAGAEPAAVIHSAGKGNSLWSSILSNLLVARARALARKRHLRIACHSDLRTTYHHTLPRRGNVEKT